MNVQPLAVTQQKADALLRAYKAHRGVYDKHDWEIERIYRQIARGRTVISASDAIVRSGFDSLGRPRLAIMRADQQICHCQAWADREVVFTNDHRSRARDRHFVIPWPDRAILSRDRLAARLPRIPPQHRPLKDLSKYHILWEADWTSIPRDPYLLRRISKDAFLVLAAWDLTDVEISVLRAHTAH